MTYKAHLNYLLDMGFIENHPTKKNKYVLPDKEDIYFLIPLETVQFLYDCLTPDVVKIYIYLGQRDKYKKTQGTNEKYYFTYKELAEHIGIEIDNNKRNYQKIKNCLDCLCNNGLIDFDYTYQGKIPYLKLTKFSLEYKKPTQIKKQENK